MKHSANYRGGEISAFFTAEATLNDYGVWGSPRWWEVDERTVEINSLEILGVDVDPSQLPPSLQTAILDLADECDFEPDEGPMP